MAVQEAGGLRGGEFALGQHAAAYEAAGDLWTWHPLAAGHPLLPVQERQLGRARGANEPALRPAVRPAAGGPAQGAGPQAPPGPQSDGHVCHPLGGQVLIPLGPCHQGRLGVAVHLEPPGAGHSTKGAGGTVGLHLGPLQGHAGAAQCHRRGIWLFSGLHAVQHCGLLLAVTTQCSSPLCTVEPTVTPSHSLWHQDI